ncbi:MAG: hypothetical protein LUP01_03670 [Methanothrix sp.]|nr:hypothetical protein [Methanothrix sp.]
MEENASQISGQLLALQGPLQHRWQECIQGGVGLRLMAAEGVIRKKSGSSVVLHLEILLSTIV